MSVSIHTNSNAVFVEVTATNVLVMVAEREGQVTIPVTESFQNIWSAIFAVLASEGIRANDIEWANKVASICWEAAAAKERLGTEQMSDDYEARLTTLAAAHAEQVAELERRHAASAQRLDSVEAFQRKLSSWAYMALGWSEGSVEPAAVMEALEELLGQQPSGGELYEALMPEREYLVRATLSAEIEMHVTARSEEEAQEEGEREARASVEGESLNFGEYEGYVGSVDVEDVEEA